MSNNFEQVYLLKEIGLVNTWIGVDSMHPVASKIIGKGMNSNKKKDLIYKIGEVWKDICTCSLEHNRIVVFLYKNTRRLTTDSRTNFAVFWPCADLKH
jgi:hypothetical protein